MKNALIGLLLSFQFFTTIPLSKSFHMTPKSITAMYYMMPVLGLLMGFTLVLLNEINLDYLQVSPLLFSILVVIAGIVMTGGLHLDGWIDMGDAYFSYQDRARRLEILEDSRIGAFGAIFLVVLLLLKIGLIYEALHRFSFSINFYFMAIPFLSRLALLIYFLTMNPAKEKGLATYFKEKVIPKEVWSSLAIYTVMFCCAAYFFVGLAGIFLFGCMLFFVILYRKWTIKNFGGMSGDLVGALYEGTEVFLWGMLLFI
ncbi:adenosylcobinamide-GDP ribazoletransferase [Lysinibacillus yapensis]|uniref:Adenosylcobinamide-GDP ribazoletransferase n=1 Tax=Ureibacillus yapensis TaxID=2304605 RepID=A0A396SBR7_9BACL|nr:adenosylcobinamide-GDP ribazoletransferase [Lysinibacillus yapensis]RHW38543.1 adenosylcobinamide-GDP ribazoletransferase [Lysinibacillus yapensis]